jgi:hypothetical protein
MRRRPMPAVAALASLVLLAACAQPPAPRSVAERGLPVPLPVRVVAGTQSPVISVPPSRRMDAPPAMIAELERRLAQERLSSCLLDALIERSSGRVIYGDRLSTADTLRAALNTRAHLFVASDYFVMIASPMGLSTETRLQWLGAAVDAVEESRRAGWRDTVPTSEIGRWVESSASYGSSPHLPPSQQLRAQIIPGGRRADSCA